MRRRTDLTLMTALVILSACAAATQAAQTPCESLAQAALPKAKITLAQSVAAGAFTLPAGQAFGPGPGPTFKDVPAFCRVTVEATPTADSDIKIEVWLPATGWNGKFRGQGNGGFAGVIDYPGLAEAVKSGYASAGTDTGHAGSGVDATWALGHPEKVIDFGYRGVHEMTLKAKALIDAFYGSSAQRSYFAACSDGGREALMEAQRFPEDYDGILAGAPANYWTHLLTSAMADVKAATQDPASYIPASKMPALSAAVLAACDAGDGVTDGIVSDPMHCRFQPTTLLCHGAESDACLTPKQAATLMKLYEGPNDPHGHKVFPGYVPGGEDGPGGWGLWITGSAPDRSLLSFFGVGYFRNMVYEKADWDPKTFEIGPALDLADAKTGQALNSIEPNLAPFQSRGGKLIVYHGWADAAIAAPNSINYYNSVVAKMGPAATDSFARLFMAPGLQHCGGGPGPNSFGQFGASVPNDPDHSIYLALEQWVEKGRAPAKVIATKFVDDSPAKGVKMTRPLCPYPEAAFYKGTGDVNDAANFVCAPGR
ncbi:MAG TPA: tannase/feruloyl esterase family alpha/beta hydrolase, partial [Terriglobia bacterium]|nr:tannase/feruloyl esterase family alpha/beta hydrolase [Terriglobia bacterium]